MNVPVLSAHPDDVEVYCADTLIKCVARGAEYAEGFRLCMAYLKGAATRLLP